MLSALLGYLLPAAALSLALLAAGLVLACAGLYQGLRKASAASQLSQELRSKATIGFFHPYCAAGGGGERVLWCAIHAIQQAHPDLVCVVYTGDTHKTPADMIANADSNFGVKLQKDSVRFVFLRKRRWVEAAAWPRFTLLGQSLGSIVLAYEALCAFVPNVMIDSMGYAFTYPLFRLAGRCRLGAYVHYPTISTDMLARVRQRDVAVCNDGLVARSSVLSAAKLLYYKLFALAYSWVGSFAEIVMTNSSWTRGHIDQLWRVADGRISTVFPPCDTSALAALPLSRPTTALGGHLVLSLAQFRPEKDHPMQLRAFARFLEATPRAAAKSGSAASERVRLVVVGGCRDAGDLARLDALKKLCGTLGLQMRDVPDGAKDIGDWDVDFQANLPIQEVHRLLGEATVGIHTMRDEHFGISVVEFMAAGAIVLAHNSAGPAMDIVVPVDGQQTGYLALDEASYAAALEEIFGLSPEKRLAISKAARESTARRFSQEAFEEAFTARMVAPLRP